MNNQNINIHKIPALYRGIIDCIREAVFIHDPDTGEVLDVNQPMLDMFRCQHKADVIGSNADKFSLGEPPYSSAEVAIWVKKAATEGPQLFKWRAKRLDGTLFWSEVSLTSLQIAGASFIIAVVRDISQRMKQETELEYSRSRYQALFENVNRAVAIYHPITTGDDLDFVIVDMNSSAERIEGLKREEVKGRSVLEIFPGIKDFGLFDVFEKVWRTGVPQHHPVAHYTDARIHGWRDNVVYKLPSGEIVAVYEDRSREKEMEEALRHSESLLKAIFDAVPAAICLVDPEKRIFKWISPYIENITGFKPSELIGKTPRILYATEEEYQRVGRAYRVFAKRDLVDMETVFQHKDGRKIAILLKAVKLEQDILCAIFDITDRKRADQERMEMERQLLHVQKLESLGVLAGGIAHDFNNLLMGIIGNAELLSMTLPEPSNAEKYINAIKRASDRASELCSQMLAYAGKGRVATEEFDISKKIEEMESILRVSISKTATLKFDLASGLPDIAADPAQISQVIMNLIVNASDALEDRPGTITVTTGSMECDCSYLSNVSLDEQLTEGTYVYLEVSDTGRGMDDSVKKRIFEPFFTTNFAGRGLGMAAIHGIVRGHHGGIKIDSEPGEGTTVRVLLPAARLNQMDPGLAGPVRLKGTGDTVLLVDDEAPLRELGREMLEVSGFSVLTAENGRAALEVFQKHMDEIKCVILDLTMPEMGGEEALRELKRIKPHAKIIISSGYNAENVTTRFNNQGIAGFLQKPYRIKELQTILKQVIEI